jgi:hypothetical protein
MHLWNLRAREFSPPSARLSTRFLDRPTLLECGPMDEPSRRFTLRDLPFVARLTLALFLIAVGFGYFSALVQLHVQQASPGQILPGDEELRATYHGTGGMSVLERLVTANENLPFDGSGTMRPAFKQRALDYNGPVFEDRAYEKYAASLPPDLKDEEKQDKWDKLDSKERQKKIDEAQDEIRKEHEGEADALVAWIHADADKASYDGDNFPRPDSLKDTPITKKYLTEDKKGVKIRSLIRSRCARCHQAGREVPDAPLTEYKQVLRYAKMDSAQTGPMPMRKLAQSTHVHLLGFSMLYGLTGLIFALTSWPGIIRLVIAPLALVAQVVDISFWWLARLQDPYGSVFAKCIMYSGGVVAVALGLQILLSLFSLFGWFGRVVLVLLILLLLAGGYFLHTPVLEVVAPDLVPKVKEILGF